MDVDNEQEHLGGIIELNVGGRHFSTTRATLRQHPSSYFARLLEEDDMDTGFVIRGAQRDSQNLIFIDRDPDIFALILEYLRWTIDIDRLSEREIEKLRKEALYYQLDGLLDMLPRSPYDPSQLSKDDQAIRSKAQQIRESLKQRVMNPKEEIDGELISLFDEAEGRRTFALFDSPLTSPKSTVLFDKHVEQARANRGQSCSPPETGPHLKNFPMQNLVIAGGAVLQCLQGTIWQQNISTSDIDLFLIADDEATAKATFDRILDHLARDREEVAHHELLVVRSALTVTFCIGYPHRHLQLILRLNQCVGDVLFHFDIDCCQVAFDGKRVLATPSAHRAIQTGINIADPERCGLLEDYEGRLAKFADRGFLVAVPGLNVTKIKDEYLRNCCYGISGGKLKRVHLDFTTEQDRPSFRLGDQSVEGLAKLLVYSTIYPYKANMEEHERVARRNQDITLPWLGRRGSPLGTGNYLLDYPRIAEGVLKCTWKKPTPPFPPPYSILSPARYVRFGSAGGPLLPYDPAYSLPSLIYQQLSNASLEPEVRVETDQRLVCFDLIRNTQ